MFNKKDIPTIITQNLVKSHAMKRDFTRGILLSNKLFTTAIESGSTVLNFSVNVFKEFNNKDSRTALFGYCHHLCTRSKLI